MTGRTCARQRCSAGSSAHGPLSPVRPRRSRSASSAAPRAPTDAECPVEAIRDEGVIHIRLCAAERLGAGPTFGMEILLRPPLLSMMGEYGRALGDPLPLPFREGHIAHYVYFWLSLRGVERMLEENVGASVDTSFYLSLSGRIAYNRRARASRVRRAVLGPRICLNHQASHKHTHTHPSSNQYQYERAQHYQRNNSKKKTESIRAN
eukprot:scaffold3318_cov110-Isochrysis_galbana.AAC.3